MSRQHSQEAVPPRRRPPIRQFVRQALKEATMYSSVRRLEVDGDIEWYWGDESQGGRRKYFRITAKGKATYDRNKSNWEYAKRVLENLL
jgi:PadR family transcriptional regulator, regulatory protein PadR